MAVSKRPFEVQSVKSSHPEYGDHIDQATFEQILEMDDDKDEHDFSKGIVYEFLQQAQNTFKKMDSFLESGDLAELSALGHFLKGSSATLGLTKVKDSCEKIQHYGANQDENGTHDEPDASVSLTRMRVTIAKAKTDFQVVEKILRKFYGE